MNKEKTETISKLRNILAVQLNDLEDGRVFCEIAPVESTTTERVGPYFLLMPILGKLGFTLGDTELIEMPRSLTERVAEDLFRGPLGGPQKLSELEVHTLASSFLYLFEENAKFYSTFKYKIDPVSGFITYLGRGLLGSSYESGFFVVDSTQIGCLLVGDED